MNKNAKLSLNRNAIPSLMKYLNKFVHREVNRYAKQSMKKFAPQVLSRTVKLFKIENAQLILRVSVLLEQKENATLCMIQSMKRSARLKTNSYVAMYRNRCVTLLINNNATLSIKKFVSQLNLLMEEMEEEEDLEDHLEDHLLHQDMVLLQLLPVAGFLNKNVKMSQDSSAKIYQDRLQDNSVIMCQDRSARTSLRKFVIM